MLNLASKQNQPVPQAAELTHATVTGLQQSRLTLSEPDLPPYRARRAPSCLLEPREGDTVLVAHTAGGRAFVTAVLERQGPPGPGRLSLEGDVELRAARGSLRLTARDGLELASARSLRLAAPELALTAQVGRVVVDNLSLAGRVAQAGWDQVRLAARSADTVVDRLLQRFKTRSTRVDQLDRQRARMLHQQVDEVHALQTGTTVMRSREEMRVDGKQIIIG
jgi:hypothetical protein